MTTLRCFTPLLLATVQLGTYAVAQDGPIKVNGGRVVEESLYSKALEGRSKATLEESKPFTTLFNSRDIAQCFYQELDRVTITWKYAAKPNPECLKDSIIQVETLDGAGKVVGKSYSRLEVPHPKGKGLIFPFDNMKDTGKRIRITILPAEKGYFVTITLPIARL